MQAWLYVGELLRRVFFPTTRGADYLSVLLPLTLAASAKFAGVTVSDDATIDILAYIGAFTIAMFLLRLFFTAPYAMWREQVGQVADLKLELSRPERIEHERLARHRAKKRIELSALVRRMHWTAYGTDRSASLESLNQLFVDGVVLQGEAGTCESFDTAFDRLSKYCKRAICDAEYYESNTYPAFHLIEIMTDYLHGRVTAEVLALQLTPDIEEEKQP